MVSTLPSNVNAVVVSAESLPKHVQAATEIISLSHEDALSAGLTKAYVEKGDTDILQQNQQLDCVSEEEISTSAHEGMVCLFCNEALNHYNTLECSGMFIHENKLTLAYLYSSFIAVLY